MSACECGRDYPWPDDSSVAGMFEPVGARSDMMTHGCTVPGCDRIGRCFWDFQFVQFTPLGEWDNEGETIATCQECCRQAETAMLEHLRTMPYRLYLRTEHWKLERHMALERAKRRCQLCARREQLHVHHNSYENRGHEQPEDLAVLCAGCHQRFHGIKR